MSEHTPGKLPPRNWADHRRACVAACRGDKGALGVAFKAGMETVFDVLEDELPTSWQRVKPR
jgi:hypothetical protein